MGLPVGPPQGGTPLLPSPGQPKPMAPGEFKAGSVPQLTTFTISNIAPPSPEYIGRDDQLFIQAISLQPNEIVTVNVRMLVPVSASAVGGQPDAPVVSDPSRPPLTTIDFGSATVNLPVINTPVTKLVPLAEGFLLSVAALSTLSAERGGTYVKCSLLRGGTSIANVSHLLFSDYCTQTAAAGWPYGRVLSSLEGPGQILQFNVANPAAGADWTLLIPTLQRWRIISVQATLTTSAAVANRIPALGFALIGIATGKFTPSGVVPASTTAVVTGTSGSPITGANVVDINVGLPPGQVLGPGTNFRLSSITSNIQAADQWSLINGYAEVWLDF